MCYNDYILLVLGAILGLLISLMWKYLSDLLFGVIFLTPRKGKYKVTLKNGQPLRGIENANIVKVRSRKIKIVVESDSKEDGNAEGEIEFISKNYGRGFYKHIKSNKYGFYEFVLLPNGKIAALRKYTTDKKIRDYKRSEAIETSFIWEKQ